MREPLVSVVIPTYNRAKTIKETIFSVLNQTYACIEIIVIDDASVDDTEDIVTGIADDRIYYEKNEKNLGANISRNKGIARARGEYIAFIDSADRWAYDKLEKQLWFIQNDVNKPDIVFCAEHINTPKEDFVIPTNEEKELIQRGELGKIFSTGKNCVDTSSIFCKKECFSMVGGFDVDLPRCQEYEWLLRAIQKCKIEFLDECLVEANIRDDSISADISKLLRAVPQIYNKHHDFFALYGKPVDILLSPVRELCKIGKDFSFYEKYFEFMNQYIDTAWRASIDFVYLKTLRLIFYENIRNQYRLQNVRDGYNLEALLNKKIIFNIFGAGEIAKDLYIYLKKTGLNSLVRYALVTSTKNNRPLDEDVPLIKAESCDVQIKEMPLLLAINNFNMLDVLELLEKLEFKKIVIVSQDEWNKPVHAIG